MQVIHSSLHKFSKLFSNRIFPKYKKAILYLILMGSLYSVSAQMETSRLKVLQINDSTILDQFLIAYTNRDMRTQLGIPTNYRSAFGISWMNEWPLYEMTETSNPENIICQAFRKHYNNYSVWVKNYTGNSSVPSWLLLDSTMSVKEILPINADNHGLDIDANGNVLTTLDGNFGSSARLDFCIDDTGFRTQKVYRSPKQAVATNKKKKN